MNEPTLQPTSPSPDPDATSKMMRPTQEVEEKILALKIKGVKGRRFKDFVQKLKQDAQMAGLDIIHAELEKSGKKKFGGSMDVDTIAIDPNKLADPNFKGGELGPKVTKMKKKEKEHSKLSPEELAKMGYSPEDWEAAGKRDAAAKKAAKAAGTYIDDEDES